MLGGEHTITFGALQAIQPELVYYFDAHMDLRDSLFGLKLSHGTFLRRAMEELDFKLIILGCRAVSKHEMEFANRNDDRVKFLTASELNTNEINTIVSNLEEWLDDISSTYISIDMDVVDPSQAPAVGNPAPEGISITKLLDLIKLCTDENIRGFDLTEVSPFYDSGFTVIQAAYVILETIYTIESV
jgi:agmatinase